MSHPIAPPPQDATAIDSNLERHIHEVQGAERASFHMPGHKGGRGAPSRARELLGEAVFAADLSELSGFDYLHGASSALIHAQERAAAIFGARQSWFLVNGATVGNLAALCSVVGDGDEILVARDSHRSVFAGLVLSGARPRYLAPQRNELLDGLYGIDAEEVRRVLTSNPAIKAVHLTSPSYYGFTSAVSEVVAVAHALGCIVIVDEAHGGHFPFDGRLPACALENGADLVVQSPHKTLGSLTQSSLLHAQGDLVNYARVQSYLGMLQSSSPSALLLASLDLSIEEMATVGRERWADAVVLAESARHQIAEIPGLVAYGDEIVNTPGITSFDPTKLVVDVAGLGTTGFAAGRWLREERGVNPEFSDLRRMVFSLTIGDTKETIALLIDALAGLSQTTHLASAHPHLIALWTGELPEAPMTPREAQHCSTRPIAFGSAAGEITAEMIVPYPPGVPLLVAGERITAEAIEAIDQLRAAGCRIVGPFDRTGETIRIIDTR
jgi:arginine/lysine/ornithine decarboxylase